MAYYLEKVVAATIWIYFQSVLVLFSVLRYGKWVLSDVSQQACQWQLRKLIMPEWF